MTKNELTSSNLTAGRLEVYYNGQWGTVCGDGFSSQSADVACHQLGFQSAIWHATTGQPKPGQPLK